MGGLLLLALAVVALIASGRMSEFANPEYIAALLESAGPFGPILFVVLIVALFPVFLIGPPIWGSLALWPAPLAIFYSSVGCIVASVVVYVLARFLGQERAQHRIPEKIRKYEERLVTNPFRTILLLRVLLWANPAVDLLVGVSRVRPRDYLLATVVGLVPTTAFHVLAVGAGFGLALKLPGEVWIAVGLAIGAFVLVRTVRNRRAESAAAATAAAERSDA
jgi:uncharacterized membrane protein YdjX (TVP38/TMEM64 family)